MSLFDWLRGRRKPREPELEFLGPKARPHHYLFVHKVFPAHIWNGDSVLGILANLENQEFTVDLWTEVGRQLEPHDRLSPEGMRHSSHWIGGEHLVILVELPKAEIPPEALFVAITTSPQIRYLTLEKSSLPGEAPEVYVSAEWKADGTRGNYGEGSAPTPTAFLGSICRLLSLPEAIEPPTRQQLQGMRRGGLTMDMTMPEGFPEEDEGQVEVWEQEAESALDGEDYGRAEQFYRQVLDLRMSRQGPENTVATLAYGQLVQVMTFQGKYQEAEALCRAWWKLCRRYRMLGHAETMSATRTLAECLRSQGRHREAADLMVYRVLLGRLARGGDSMIAEQARSELALFEEAGG